ncbi:MAG: 23S rRNA (guanosine(2251)-2'-O)-methyltransferase RlmB [Anaerolineae bacterium]
MGDVVYGRHPVLEALRADEGVQRLLIAKGTQTGGPLGEILSLAQVRGIRVAWVDRRELDRLGAVHQGVAAELAPFEYADLDDILAAAAARGEPPLLLVLDAIQDVHNLGSLLRTADAVGAHGAILPAHRAAGVTPAVRKASAGAVAHLPIAQVTNLRSALEGLKRQGVWVVGLDMAGQTAFDAYDWRGPVALVIGSEGKGLGRLVAETCDVLVQLPMRGHVDSLNAAVAGSIVLYHAWRSRRAPPL